MGEMQNKRKKEKENKKTFSSKLGETFNSVKKTELDKGCSFHFRSSVQLRLTS